MLSDDLGLRRLYAATVLLAVRDALSGDAGAAAWLDDVAGDAGAVFGLPIALWRTICALDVRCHRKLPISDAERSKAYYWRRKRKLEEGGL